MGVLVISIKKSNVDLFHVLFGNILALDGDALSLLAAISSVSVIVMAIIYRPLIIECVDSSFLRRSSNASAVAHFGFLFLMVINLVAGFHALGTPVSYTHLTLPTIYSV